MPIKMKFELGSPDNMAYFLYKQMYGKFDGKVVNVYGFYHASYNGERDYAYVRFPGRDYLESVELTFLKF